MRLLIFVNKFDKNDDLLGFFVGWVNELAKHPPSIIVITQSVGEYDRLANLKVISIDKAKNPSPFWRVVKFKWLLWRLRLDYDGIFVIMAPAWAIVASGAAKLLGKKLYLWYAVWRGNWKLKLAEKLVDKIFCSVEEAFPFKTSKLVLLGQGIDTDYLVPDSPIRETGFVLFLGRISPVKKIEVLLEALAKLPEAERAKIKAEIVGGTASPSDDSYLNDMKGLAQELKISNQISWLGRVGHESVKQYYQRTDIFVNLTPTGSFDKTMLESMACGDLVLASNQALARFLSPELRELLIFRQDDANDLSSKLKNLLNLNPSRKDSLRNELREIIIKNHSQKQWATNLIKNL
jgi:glycosyltransferase involved in cell wall biosynthesis